MLEVKDLVKSYNSKKALDSIGFTLKKGEVYGLLGPNGAGKTTTLKILAGLLLFDSGEILVEGNAYDRSNTDLKRLIAYVPDSPFVYEKLTGEEHLHFYADLYKIPKSLRHEKFDFFFKYFEFEAYRKQMVETYSAGTRQKLLLSQALLVEPKILLLDEPLTSIDPLVARKFKNYIKETASKGMIIIFATHILSLAQEVSTKIGVIINGKIVTEGSLEYLLEISKGADLEEFYYHTVMKHDKST